MTRQWKTAARLAAAAAAVLPLGGCITVKAPEKPIDVNLNVAIKQEVVVRLQREVEDMINKNPNAFPAGPTRP